MIPRRSRKRTACFAYLFPRNPTELHDAHPLFVALDFCPPHVTTATRIYGLEQVRVNEGETQSDDKVSGDGMEEDLSISSSTLARSFQERIFTHQKLFRDFCDALEYQIQFDGCRMLTILE